MPNFPKTEKIEFRLRQDLADQLPAEKGERNAFLNRVVEQGLKAMSMWKKGGSAKSEKKAAAARENARKGGWTKGRSRKQPEQQ
jgi:hypothetical protein